MALGGIGLPEVLDDDGFVVADPDDELVDDVLLVIHGYVEL